MGKKRGKHRTDYPKWMGIHGLEFVWHGEWSDPEIRRGRWLINVHVIEDPLVDMYRRKHPEDGDTQGFDAWARLNADIVREEADFVVANRADYGIWVRPCR